MRKLMFAALAALAFAGCGGQESPTATPPAAPTTEAGGYSQGVKDYYGDGDAHPEAEPGSIEDVESEYHQPPQPAEAGVGETITLTGTNIGVRQAVTVTGVERTGDYVAVMLELENTGIANYEGPLRNATVRFGDGGAPTPVSEGAKAACSHGFERETVYIPVGEKASGCLLFPARSKPRELQLALEIVPTGAGGIWTLE